MKNYIWITLLVAYTYLLVYAIVAAQALVPAYLLLVIYAWWHLKPPTAV